jgi:diguanylate cyclase (GGDEF)-like protein
MNTLSKFLFLTVLYLISGKLCLLLTLPPTFTPIIWLPAGLALVSLLTFGYRFWAGIFLASFLLNLGMFSNFSNLPATDYKLISALMALGSSMQALLGAYFVRCFLKGPLALEKEEDILSFFFLGGAISCLFGSFITVFTLVLHNELSIHTAFLSVWIWWIGNVMGILIFTPVLMTFIAEPKEIWRPRRISVALPITIIFIIAAVLFYMMKKDQESRIHAKLALQSMSIVEKIENHLKNYFNELNTLQSFQRSSENADQIAFSQFAKKHLKHKSMIAMEWISATGTIPGTVDNPSFPITYVEPFEKYKEVIGTDLKADPSIRPALESSAQSGNLTLTKPMNVMPDGANYIIAFLPVYNDDEPLPSNQDKTKHLKGFVALIINIQNLISRDVAGFENKVEKFYAADKDPLKGNIELFNFEKNAFNLPSNDVPRMEPSFYLENTLKIGGRDWFFRTLLIDDPAIYKNSTAWFITICSLLFIAFICILLLILSGRKTLINRLIKEKTDHLRAEIEYSNKISENLAKSKEDLLKLSITDPLTGLMNRRGLELQAIELLKLSKRYNKKMFLFFIDIDQMKQVNDSLGHKMGDEMLVEVASILKEFFRGTDVIARLGGDEFCVLLTAMPGDENFVVKRLQLHVDQHNTNCPPSKPLISLSIGWTTCETEHEFDLEKLIAQADKMMYIYKQSKKKDI